MKKMSIIILLLLFAILSCSKRYTISNFSEYQRKYELLYSEAEIHEAKRYTEELIKEISEYKRRDVKGLNYELMLSLSFARLYLINTDLNNEQAARQNKVKIKGFIRNNHVGIKNLEEETFKIIDFARNIDIKNSVKWIDE